MKKTSLYCTAFMSPWLTMGTVQHGHGERQGFPSPAVLWKKAGRDRANSRTVTRSCCLVIQAFGMSLTLCVRWVRNLFFLQVQNWGVCGREWGTVHCQCRLPACLCCRGRSRRPNTGGRLFSQCSQGQVQSCLLCPCAPVPFSSGQPRACSPPCPLCHPSTGLVSQW